MSAPYPWLARPWSNLQHAVSQERLGHAILLSGREGVGLETICIAVRELHPV